LPSGALDTTVANTTTSYSYDAAGRILTSTDSLNRTTNYSYYSNTAFTGTDPNAIGHTIGDLQSITNPAGHITTFNSYDKSGRILQTTDPKGVVTAMSYTPRGWISSVTTTAPGQTARTTNYSYDNVGQLTGVTNPDGSTLAYSYDAAHRLIGATDAKGNSISYTLDNMGNRIKEDIKDPSGTLQRSINRSFDALNRLQQVSGVGQ
jgi:YD repeat-containing protein